MKKITALLMILALIVCAAFAQGMVGMPNPVSEYETLEEVNALTGCNLCTPGVMGVTDQRYSVIDCGEFAIAQCDYCVNGYPCTLRAAAGREEDISGVYTGEGSAFGEKTGGELRFAEAENMKLAQWFDGDIQYTLTVEDAGELTQEQFEGIAAEVKRDCCSEGN